VKEIKKVVEIPSELVGDTGELAKCVAALNMDNGTEHPNGLEGGRTQGHQNTMQPWSGGLLKNIDGGRNYQEHKAGRTAD